jgi:hypothetical protein
MTLSRWLAAWMMSVMVGGALVLAQARAVSDQDKVIGAWELDTAASHYSPGPAPAKEIRTYEDDHEGVKATIVMTDAEGQQRSVEYVASYNDVVAIVTGSERIDAIRMRKVNDTTAESTLSYQGKVVGTAKRVISPDGRSMTITFKRDAPSPVDNVAIYRKVAADR